MKLFIVFPTQLFEDITPLNGADLVLLIEDSLFFGDKQYSLSFHKHKLVLHRASMKFYESYLKEMIINTRYIDYQDVVEDPSSFYAQQFQNHNITTYEPIDFILKKRLINAAKKSCATIDFVTNPGFINSSLDNVQYLTQRKRKKLLHNDFYISQRKRLRILMEDQNAPIYRRWTFDTENRKRLPISDIPPKINLATHNAFIPEAVDYVSEKFANNPPFLQDNYADLVKEFYPTTFSEAKKLLNSFIEQRLYKFGPYEDALSDRSVHIYHSVLSSSLNTGLLTPLYVVTQVLEWFQKQTESEKKVVIQSVEGFIRQIIGWREFIRLVYDINGVTMRNSNVFSFTKQLPQYWYTGETSNELIATLVKKVSRFAYAHHIERLMVAGNYMLLDRIAPHDVYKWFMEMFIDAYDWVMVPNVYGMSQYTDGGSMVTKPYISGSHYLLKMGATKGIWTKEWDTMYWKFIGDYKDTFAKNSRMAMIVSLWHKRKIKLV